MLDTWSEFNVAMLGATAALAGLVIVAGSVNIDKIVAAPSLPGRFGAGIATLVLPLVVCAVGLMAALVPVVYGVVGIMAALLAAVFQTIAAAAIARNHAPQNRLKALRAGVNFVPCAAYLLGGVLLVAGSPAGLLVFAVGAILAIIVALIVSWVVMVEVLR